MDVHFAVYFHQGSPSLAIRGRFAHSPRALHEGIGGALTAIATAEQAVGGKAVGSGIEDENGAVTFEVEVIKDGAQHKVLIDTQTGKITKQALASADDEGDGDND